MSMASHVESLKRKHQKLESEIVETARYPGIDHVEIAALKREKLRVKDEIERHSASIH